MSDNHFFYRATRGFLSVLGVLLTGVMATFAGPAMLLFMLVRGIGAVALIFSVFHFYALQSNPGAPGFQHFSPITGALIGIGLIAGGWAASLLYTFLLDTLIGDE